MSLCPARMKKIKTKMKALECSQHFSKSMGNFSDVQGQLTHGPIRLNIKLSPDFMVFLVTCKNEEDLIKIEGA